MGKKQVAVSLRKPPPADRDVFVAGAEIAETPVVIAPARAANEEQPVATRVGERREVTVYLPLDIARQLSVRCMEMDRDVSNVVAEALARALTAEAPAVKVQAPPDVWARVRGLVAELRGRIPRLRAGPTGERRGARAPLDTLGCRAPSR
jgi:hypothetical protein